MTYLLINDDSNKGTASVLAGNPDHIEINSLVGGWFDCVRTQDGVLVGYVNDTGLIDGLPANIHASMIFGRPLYGPCVLVGGMSPDGEYDGDNHPVPDHIARAILSANAIFGLRPEPVIA